MNFVKFTESNDNEGEVWNFWLQLDDNEDELKKLQVAVEPDENYKLNMTPVPESEVDILVKHSDSGYMYYENKVVGKFTCPEPTEEDGRDWLDEHNWLDDCFYKAGVTEYFK